MCRLNNTVGEMKRWPTTVSKDKMFTRASREFEERLNNIKTRVAFISVMQRRLKKTKKLS